MSKDSLRILEKIFEQRKQKITQQLHELMRNPRWRDRVGMSVNAVEIASEPGFQDGTIWKEGVRKLMLEEKGCWGMRVSYDSNSLLWIYSWDHAVLDTVLAAYVLTDDSVFEEITGESLSPIMQRMEGESMVSYIARRWTRNRELMWKLPRPGCAWQPCFEEGHARIMRFVQENKEYVLIKLLTSMEIAVKQLEYAEKNTQPVFKY